MAGVGEGGGCACVWVWVPPSTVGRTEDSDGCTGGTTTGRGGSGGGTHFCSCCGAGVANAATTTTTPAREPKAINPNTAEENRLMVYVLFSFKGTLVATAFVFHGGKGSSAGTASWRASVLCTQTEQPRLHTQSFLHCARGGAFCRQTRPALSAVSTPL